MEIIQNPLLVFLLQAVPEMIAFSLLVVAISKDFKGWKKAILVGIVLVVALHFIRTLDWIHFGVHTLLFLGLAIALYEVVLNAEFAVIIKAVIAGAILVAAGEYISITLGILLLNLSVEEIINNVFWRIVLGWPQIFLLLAVAYYLFKRNVKS